MSTPQAPVALQDAAELDAFIALLKARDVRSYLEIGARYGGTFERVMRALPAGSIGVAVDFPGADFGDERSPEDLIAATRRLRADGYNVRCVFGPSGAPEVRVMTCLPGAARYDAILIDGDHSYGGVAADSMNYGRMGRIVAFHDIAAPEGYANRHGCPVEVAKFWNGIKQNHAHVEFISPGSVMGIGVVFT